MQGASGSPLMSTVELVIWEAEDVAGVGENHSTRVQWCQICSKKYKEKLKEGRKVRQNQISRDFLQFVKLWEERRREAKGKWRTWGNLDLRDSYGFYSWGQKNS